MAAGPPRSPVKRPYRRSGQHIIAKAAPTGRSRPPLLAWPQKPSVGPLGPEPTFQWHFCTNSSSVLAVIVH